MKCQGLWGLLFGHHYQARYSRVERERTLVGNIKGDDAVEMFLRPLITSTYEGDICTRCGNTIKKSA